MTAFADKIQELLAAIDVEDYLDFEGIDWKETHGSHGRQANIRTCPVCGGSSWKVYIGLETGLGNCFHGSCEAKFNKWSFIKATLGADKTGVVVDHLEKVAKELGWRPKRLVSVATFNSSEVKLPPSIPLPTPEGQTLTYLQDRGISNEMAAYFHLRFCEEGWWNFLKPDGSRGGQNFAMRLIIPVYDLNGELVTFQGRDLTGAAERKYLFPSTLPGTGRFLFNGQNAIGAKRVVLNEGGFDVMATKIACDEESELRDIVPIGSFGKHLSVNTEGGNDQLARFIKLKATGLEEVIVMWDGEPQALLDAITAGEHLQKIGLRVRVALLPKGKDPNEVHPQVVRECIWKAHRLTPAQAIKWRLFSPYR